MTARYKGDLLTTIVFEGRSNSEGIVSLKRLITFKCLSRVIFYPSLGTRHMRLGSLSHKCGCPVIRALAEFKEPGNNNIHIVFDRILLTSGNGCYFREVSDLLRTAVKCERAWYSQELIHENGTDFADDAEQLSSRIPLRQLTSVTTQDYFARLCGITTE